jgi:hypothetical protein
MSILRLVRNFALLAVLALAAHAAEARSHHPKSCGGFCHLFNPCQRGCTCDAFSGVCVKSR